MTKMKLLIALAITHVALVSHAGKVEELQDAYKKTCNKDLSSEEALRYLKDAYITCSSGQYVEIPGCQIACLKKASGVVGKSE